MTKTRIFRNVDYEKFNTDKILEKILENSKDARDLISKNPNIKEFLKNLTSEIFNSLNEIAPAEKESFNKDEQNIVKLVENFLNNEAIKNIRDETTLNKTESEIVTREFMKSFIKSLINQQNKNNSKESNQNNKSEGKQSQKNKSGGNQTNNSESKSNNQSKNQNVTQDNTGQGSNQNSGDNSGNSKSDENSDSTEKAFSDSLEKLKKELRQQKNKGPKGVGQSKENKNFSPNNTKTEYEEVNSYEHTVEILYKNINLDEIKFAGTYYSDRNSDEFTEGKIKEDVDGYIKKKLGRNLVNTELANKLLFINKYAKNNLKHKKILSSSIEPIFVIIDNSSSMNEGNKSIMSKAIALSLLDFSRKNDVKFYIAFFDSKMSNIFTLNKNAKGENFEISNFKYIFSKICRIEPKGGTDIPNAIDNSINSINKRNKLKTVIIISDGDDGIKDDKANEINKFLNKNKLRLISIIVGDNVKVDLSKVSLVMKPELLNYNQEDKIMDLKDSELSKIKIHIKKIKH